MPSSTTSSIAAVDRVGELQQQVDVLAHPRRLVEPAEPAAPRPRPSRRVGSRAQIRSTSSRVGHAAASVAALRADAVEELVERVGELLHALGLERLDDVVVVDAGLAQLLEQLPAPRRRPRAPCRRAPRRDPGTPRSSRAASCSPCPGRSAPRRRSRRGRPGSSSRSTPRGSRCFVRALAREELPARAGERLQVVLVGELRVRDRELALQLRVAERLEPLVGLGVDARDEERRDRRDLRRVAAARDEPLEPAQVGLDDGLVALEREDQRDVDRRCRARSSPRSPAGRASSPGS